MPKVYRSRIGMWVRHFEWYHCFAPPIPTHNTKMGEIIWHYDWGQSMADRLKVFWWEFMSWIGSLDSNPCVPISSPLTTWPISCKQRFCRTPSAEVVRRSSSSSITKWTVRISRERLDLESPNFTWSPRSRLTSPTAFGRKLLRKKVVENVVSDDLESNIFGKT